MVGPSVFPDSQVTRMLGPSVYLADLARGWVIRRLGPIPECLVLKYFQIHGSPKWLVLQYFQIHGSKNQVLRPKIDFSGLISSPKRLLNIF